MAIARGPQANISAIILRRTFVELLFIARFLLPDTFVGFIG